MVVVGSYVVVISISGSYYYNVFWFGGGQGYIFNENIVGFIMFFGYGDSFGNFVVYLVGQGNVIY